MYRPADGAGRAVCERQGKCKRHVFLNLPPYMLQLFFQGAEAHFAFFPYSLLPLRFLLYGFTAVLQLAALLIGLRDFRQRLIFCKQDWNPFNFLP